MSDTPEVSGQQCLGVPQCSCKCHNTDLADTLAETDQGGFYLPYDRLSMEYWREHPRFVDRRDEEIARLACTKCQRLHALAFSSRPEKVFDAEQGIVPEKLGGPHHQCEKDCHYCKGRDSIWADHK